MINSAEEFVALRTSDKQEEYLRAATDSDARVRMFVATKNKLPNHLLLLLAEDEDFSVRQRVAYNTKAPLDIALRLAEDPASLLSEKRILDLQERAHKRNWQT